MEAICDFKSELVISGISGRFPKSANVDEFWQNLLNGVDMVGDANERYNIDEFDVPSRMAVLSNLDKFDAEFFAIHGKQAEVLDPRIKFLLETTYEAIIDAGMHPSEIQGSSTGVFVAACDSAAPAIAQRSLPYEQMNKYAMLGTVSSMLANRLSYNFNFHGPSYVMDTACSSSSVALQQALLSIRTGLCDAAIVASAQTTHDPIGSQCFHHLKMTSEDGKCKVFDAAADGYVRAEAVVSIYICKKQVAKRSYATLVHATTNNDGYKEQGITFPSEVCQEHVIRKVYTDTGINPLEVGYVEVHGTGTKVGDPQEMSAITKVFCEGREGPLLVGAIKSNMGHPEPVAGLCAIAKVVMAHAAGVLPANLHYNSPNPDIPGLTDGRLQVVDRVQPFDAKYVGFNSMGFGGTNVHILMKLEPREQQPTWIPTVPLMLLCSGRTTEAVEFFLDKALSHQKNRSFVGLTHEITKYDTPKHGFRGYVIVQPENTEKQVEERDSGREVWFIVTGLGSQWAGMTRDLIKFDAFRKSIKKSAKVLLVNNFDIISLLECGDPKQFEDFKNSLVSITIVQLALMDLLKMIGITPDGIVGHSTGEVASGYADGCLTQEQAALTSLARVRAFLESNLQPGMVASVGLTWEDAKKRCPPGVYPAIHNGEDNVTIAGTPAELQSFTSQLESEGIFVKLVRSASFGFHSPLVEESGKLAKILLEQIITDPKPRSKKWLSSSVPAASWDTKLAKYCSADYYVNNGVNPVYFYPTLKHVPEQVVALEIGPHCFMQSILRKSLSKEAVVLGLIHVKSPDNCLYFLNSIGKCYIAGVNVDIDAVYEPFQFPVSPPVPSISSMIRWDHSQSYHLPHHAKELSRQKGVKVSYNLLMEQDSFLEGHSIDGKILFPATGYLHLVWKCFAQQNASKFEKFPVVFENVRFERVTLLNKSNDTHFLVNIFAVSGKFEISESDMLVCSGVVRSFDESMNNERLNYESCEAPDMTGTYLNREEFYKEMHLRGYGHSGLFQGIEQADMKGRWAKIKWQGEWVSFIDTVLQAFLLLNDKRDMYVPLRIQKLTLDPNEISSHLENNDNMMNVLSWEHLRTGTCPGIELRGLNFAKFNIKSQHLRQAVVEQVFLPFLNYNSEVLTESRAFECSVELAVETISGPKLSFTEILKSPTNMIAHLIAKDCRMKCPASDFRLVNLSGDVPDEEKIEASMSKVISLQDAKALEPSNIIFVDDEENILQAAGMIVPGGFILYKGNYINLELYTDISLISTKLFNPEDNGSLTYYLLRKLQASPKITTIVSITDTDFDWVEGAKSAMKGLNEVDRVYFVSQNPCSGIAGFFKCLIRELTPEKIRCYHAVDEFDLNFEEPSDSLKTQIHKDMIFNMFKDKTWGTLSNLTIPQAEFRKQMPSSFAYANALALGDLSSLNWIESPLKQDAKDMVEVYVSSLNFRDVMLASGRLVQDSLTEKYDTDCVMGLEFSGHLNGRRVCGMGLSECLATRIDPRNKVCFEIPENWSYEEAATVPCVYITVYIALLHRGQMKAGESVLIHAGSGGVGQAAIHIALGMKCRVFTTVSTSAKREFLKQRFPALTDDSFASSRNAADFESHINIQTKGRGVDLVLNCLAQDKLYASIRCLAISGKFLEIGKFDVFNDTNIGMSILSKGVSVFGILADQMLGQAGSEQVDQMRGYIENGMKSGEIRPLSYHVFPNSQLEEAFRFMAQGKHMGKVLIQVKENEGLPASVSAQPRTYFIPTKSFVIIGGLGGMGFELAIWMVGRGAKRLVLASRSGATSNYHEYHISKWKRQEVQVIIDQSDATTFEGARSLLQNARKLGPIGGIFNVAVVLKDAMFENQTQADFEEVAKCKANATVHLDTLSGQLAPELDHFVVFSSIITARGNPGQSNYGYANAVMERICEKRKSQGRPALAVQWGAVGDVGVFHRTMKDKKVFGLAPQSLKSCLETLDLFLQQDKTIVSSFVPFERTDIGKIDPNESLVNIAANILGIKDIKKVNPKTPLVDLGMDSLMAAELSQAMQSRGNIQLSQKEYTSLTFEKLAELDAKGSSSAGVSSTEGALLQKQLSLKSMSAKAVFKMNSLGISQDVIFIIHAIDGTVIMLEELVSQLDANVYGIEFVRDAPLESIEKLASFYIQQIKEVQPSGPYKIAGYSFGGTVAFEVALQLEKQEEIVSLLLLLDSCPTMKRYAEIKEDTEAQKQEWETKLIVGYVLMYKPKDSNPNIQELFEMKSLEEKLSFSVRLMQEHYPDISPEEVKDLIGSFVNRARCVEKYDPVTKVRARTVLVKASKSDFGKDVPYDYGLSECCESAVEVTEVDGNHYCFYERPTELCLAQILNKAIA